MSGEYKLGVVNRSTPSMKAALPNLPMPETVMIRLIRIVGTCLTDYFEPVFRNIDLSENTFHVLCLLMAPDRDCASPSQLSELVGTSRANMTRIIERLEREGLASRTVEARDARRHVIRITEKGRKATIDAVPKMVESLQRAFSDLTPEELATLDTLLRKTIISFDKGGVTGLPQLP